MCVTLKDAHEMHVGHCQTFVFNRRLLALHLRLPAAKVDALLHPSHVWMGTKARWLRGGLGGLKNTLLKGEMF